MVAGNEVHAFPVMEDGVVRVDGSIHNDSVHEGSEREMDIVLVMLNETDGQAALSVCVNEQNFLLSTGKTDAEPICHLFRLLNPNAWLTVRSRVT